MSPLEDDNCSRVLTTSRGHVSPAAMPPERMPGNVIKKRAATLPETDGQPKEVEGRGGLVGSVHLQVGERWRSSGQGERYTVTRGDSPAVIIYSMLDRSLPPVKSAST